MYVLPPPGEDLVGEWATAVAEPDDTLVGIAHRHRVGYNAIRAANPAVDAWLPRQSSLVVLPTRQLLPMTEREEIGRASCRERVERAECTRVAATDTERQITAT